MRCPTLSNLPSPPEGKTGWPWTEESPQLPDRMPDGSPWPRISIVTPSLNQGQFIEGTIRSVLLQGYPDVEYMIIDGVSTDGSKEIIDKYSKWLTYWVSESDQGQSHAINKGLKRATGDLAGWLNSDDIYLPRAFSIVADQFSLYPEIEMIYGDINLVNEEGEFISEYRSHQVRLEDASRLTFVPQPACFWRTSLFPEIGYLNEDYNYIFDLDYWLRISLKYQTLHCSLFLASFRVHENAKTQKGEILTALEGLTLNKKLFTNPFTPRHILKFKRRELRHWYERLARAYFAESKNRDACAFFLKAIIVSPWRPQNLKLLTMAIYAILKHEKVSRP